MGNGLPARLLAVGRKRLPDVAAREMGEVQKALNIVPEASFALSIKNPEASSPAGASLPQTEKADYPDKLQEEFRDRRLAHEDVPTLHLPRMGTPIKPLFEGVWE